jgi:hypothetical protein
MWTADLRQAQMGPRSGPSTLASTTAPPRRSGVAATPPGHPEPSRRLQLPAVEEHRRRGITATVHRRLPTSPTWEEPAPGRERSAAAGTAWALPGGLHQRRRWEEEGEKGSGARFPSPLESPVRGRPGARNVFP